MTELLSGEGWARSRGGLLLPPHYTSVRRPTCIDLFAGCGGFSLGFHQAGFDVLAAVEWDVAAATTYLVNLGGPCTRLHFDSDRKAAWNRFQEKHGAPAGSGWASGQDAFIPVQDLWLQDIRGLTGEKILEPLGLEVGAVDVVVGGPPCQGFSHAGRREVMDPRNSLVFEFARLILEINPKTFVMENVPGIVSMVTPEGIPVVDAFCRILEDGGFGAFDALKRSLASLAGTGAALRGKATASEEAVEEELELQGSLAL